MQRFRARLEPVPHGGQYVIVPDRVAAAAGLAHRARVRGDVNGAVYRSALMMYRGVFHLGVHKATLQEAGVYKPGARVLVTIELDAEPLPTDVVPDDLATALRKDQRVASAWSRLAPSHKREHVKALLSAKRPETRARRLAGLLAALHEKSA
jgi:bacteriocin resistance YdeI/OmpD-like protein/uncharacterized protein DUF1905